MGFASHVQDNFLGHHLDARRKIHVPLFQWRLGLAGRSAEQVVKPAVRHRQPLAIVEIIHVHPEAAVAPEFDQVPANGFGKLRPAIGRQTHELVFAAVDLEPAVIGERGIQQPQRMGKLQFAQQPDTVAFAIADGRRAPFAHAVEREDCRCVKRAGKECARGVALVMFRENKTGAPRRWKPLPQHPPQVNLVLEPERHRQAKAAKTRGGKGEIRFQQPVELEQRFVVKSDVVQFCR